jgi:hypothetical protein
MPSRPDATAPLRTTRPPGPPGRRSPASRVRRAGALGLALALTLGAAGCGKQEGTTVPGPDSPTPALSRVQFTAQANEICRATTKAIVERNDDLAPSNLGGGDDATKARREIETLARTAIAHLRNLTPPPEDAATARRAWDTMEAAVDNASRDATLPLDPVGLVQPELFDYGLSGCFATR